MLHRRQLAVQPHVDAQRGERAVRLALRDDEHRRAGLELAALGGRDGHHHGLRRHQDLLLATLVLHGHDAVVRHLDDVGDVRVGHLAVGPQIPVVVPMNLPLAISSMLAFVVPMATKVSASFILMLSPLRAFTVRFWPSSDSTVPRILTGGLAGAWAAATAERAASRTAAMGRIMGVSFSMDQLTR